MCNETSIKYPKGDKTLFCFKTTPVVFSTTGNSDSTIILGDSDVEVDTVT